MTSQRTVLVAAAALLFGASAFAQTNKAPTGAAAAPTAKVDSFKSLDKNKDGYVDHSEASAATGLASQFGTLDTNKDGKLSSAEFGKQVKHN
jgi:hypothetical protein